MILAVSSAFLPRCRALQVLCDALHSESPHQALLDIVAVKGLGPTSRMASRPVVDAAALWRKLLVISDYGAIWGNLLPFGGFGSNFC